MEAMTEGGTFTESKQPWPPRVQVLSTSLEGHHRVIDAFKFTEKGKDTTEYLSTEEHTHLLAEAVREAKAQAIECLRGNLEERFTDEEIEALKQFVTQSELRKGATPENGGENG